MTTPASAGQEGAAGEAAAPAPKPARQRASKTVSLPGRGSAAKVVDAPSVVDDLRTTPLVPGAAAGVAPLTPLSTTARPAAPPQTATAPPPPKKRQLAARIQFSTKLPPGLIGDVKDFSDHHEAEIQIVVELALKEYLTSRGWQLSS